VSKEKDKEKREREEGCVRHILFIASTGFPKNNATP